MKREAVVLHSTSAARLKWLREIDYMKNAQRRCGMYLTKRQYDLIWGEATLILRYVHSLPEENGR